MNLEHESFVLHKENLAEQVDDLTVEEAGSLFKAIVYYANGMPLPEMTKVVKLVFTPIKNQLERDDLKWEEIRQKRSEAGKKGGRPPKDAVDEVEVTDEKANAFFDKQTKAKKAVNVNASVNGSVNGTGNVNASVNEHGNGNASVNGNVSDKFNLKKESKKETNTYIEGEKSLCVEKNVDKKSYEQWQAENFETVDDSVMMERGFSFEEGRKRLSHAQIMEDFGVSNTLKHTLTKFLRACYINGHLVSNEKLENIIVRLDMNYRHDEPLKCASVERAISGGYFDIAEK